MPDEAKRTARAARVIDSVFVGVRDALGVGGIALATYGLYSMYEPAASVFLGLTMMAIGLVGSRGKN